VPGQAYCVAGKVNIADKLYLVIELVRLDSPATPSALAFPFLLTAREVFPWTESRRREKTPAQGRVLTPSVPGSCARTRKVTSTAAGQTGETAALLNRRGHYLYSSGTDSLTGIPLSTVNPPQNEFGVRGYALNADGSKIAVASATEVSFFDRSFTFLGSAQPQTAFQTARSAVQFTPDGTRLFLQYALPLWLEEVDATKLCIARRVVCLGGSG
jgi:hypothetical protein